MSEETTKTGQCMCGAVKYTASTSKTFAVCYCKMCQRWSAGVYMGASTSHFAITEGEDQLTVFKSSEWAERAFCSVCGSNIYYFAPKYGGKSVALGSFDDPQGFTMHSQYFIDQKASGFSMRETTKTLTTAQIEAALKGG
jgi:hypothetical protein